MEHLCPVRAAVPTSLPTTSITPAPSPSRHPCTSPARKSPAAPFPPANPHSCASHMGRSTRSGTALTTGGHGWATTISAPGFRPHSWPVGPTMRLSRGCRFVAARHRPPRRPLLAPQRPPRRPPAPPQLPITRPPPAANQRRPHTMPVGAATTEGAGPSARPLDRHQRTASCGCLRQEHTCHRGSPSQKASNRILSVMCLGDPSTFRARSGVPPPSSALSPAWYCSPSPHPPRLPPPPVTQDSCAA